MEACTKFQEIEMTFISFSMTNFYKVPNQPCH